MKNITSISIAVAFWLIVIILCVNCFENPFKSDTSLEKFNNKLNGKWYDTEDSIKLEYITYPTNKFQSLTYKPNIIGKIRHIDTSEVSIGDFKIVDIEVEDTLNYVYYATYIDAFNNKYYSCVLRIVNDTTIFLTKKEKNISKIYIKTND